MLPRKLFNNICKTNIKFFQNKNFNSSYSSISSPSLSQSAVPNQKVINYSHSLLTNKNRIKISWIRNAVQEILPNTCDLITERGRSMDNLSFAVAYCVQRNYDDLITIDEETQKKVYPKKLIDDSWLEMILPFSADLNLREAFKKTDGVSMRYGKLFEILDALASDVSYRHCKEIKKASDNFFIVTACVDAFDLHEEISMNSDLKLQGYLTYVGKSSMEVTIDIISDEIDGSQKLIGSTKYIMVARDGDKGATIFGLETTNKEAEAAFKLSERRSLARKKKASTSLEVSPPLPEEISILHNLHLKSKKLENLNHLSSSQVTQLSNYKKMKDTLFKNTILMYPQNRNVHGKIFGGFIMKIAFELGWISAGVFLGEKNVEFLYVDEIQFVRPVNIGSIVEFSSSIIYSEGEYCVVLVTAHDVSPLKTERTVTNVLTYIFRSKDRSKTPEVLPLTYDETMLYLQGRRALEDTLKRDDQF